MNQPVEPMDGGLYEARQKIYPREIDGRFQRLRTIAAWVLLGIFYAIPWLPWGQRQAVLFDLPARKFHIFALTLWPQDFYFLTWLLVIAALSLFFFTALAGRVFCGYACPQTVWTETFLWMERLRRGHALAADEARQGAVDRRQDPAQGRASSCCGSRSRCGPASRSSATSRRSTSSPARSHSFSTGPWETFWVLFYGGATYVNAGFMREQVCKYMCPYARFQSAMFDKDTLIITYDEQRGEPRGARKKGVDPKAKGLGDCVDCTLCVQVCPTGIDIRKGLQYECIACAACIDACDEVMDKVGYPRGLIRYDTQHGIEGKPKRVLRPRTIVYATLLAAAGDRLRLHDHAPQPRRRGRAARPQRAVPRAARRADRERLQRQDPQQGRRGARVPRSPASGLPGLVVDYAGPTVWVGSGEVQGVPVRIRVPREDTRGRRRHRGCDRGDRPAGPEGERQGAFHRADGLIPCAHDPPDATGPGTGSSGRGC